MFFYHYYTYIKNVKFVNLEQGPRKEGSRRRRNEVSHKFSHSFPGRVSAFKICVILLSVVDNLRYTNIAV